ncbi:unnamed protein product [Tuber melanosporum]|uniref:(Perigord truffle) hypothetical protein n=1 Tax=Tuber melanosporum (strain Mel28) TaxID=656061 RepID=D5G9V2_TUBMM|nr:uncharacterized protein GSTUM_00005088001 [Tuber melanosporum]CAZ81295.1 unnamed protein product [Tuber melanosporum]
MPDSPAESSVSDTSAMPKGPANSDVREAKRRRLSIATNTLSKPFRSPLLSKPRSTATTPSPTKSVASSVGSPTSPVTDAPIATNRRRPSLQFTTRRTSSAPQNPELTKLYKQQSTLEANLRGKRALLDTAKQALNIETAADGRGEEKLQALIEKWRTAASSAADALYEITSQRATNAGPGGWKELIGKRGWDDDEKQPTYGKGGEDEEFTMGVMLKALGIDPELIGYDQDNDCWK